MNQPPEQPNGNNGDVEVPTDIQELPQHQANTPPFHPGLENMGITPGGGGGDAGRVLIQSPDYQLWTENLANGILTKDDVIRTIKQAVREGLVSKHGLRGSYIHYLYNELLKSVGGQARKQYIQVQTGIMPRRYAPSQDSNLQNFNGNYQSPQRNGTRPDV